ncbi:MAG: cupin domain-containing protein [Burkholderiales bacterium]|nr:cupin domain-containing protein [Burkholderiales bacterium]
MPRHAGPDATLALVLPLLGNRSPRDFLARYWQREALLVRAAIPGFTGMLARRDVFALAARDDVESRLMLRAGRRYTLTHGPFRRADFRGLPECNWTLLVHGVNLHHDGADALLRRFAFVPYARLDDVMVSYAAPGGGVGPHFDSYDVFLLQGFGRRRWRYGRQANLALRPNLPVKILARFEPAHDAVLGPGDMLYLPPAYAHDGVALDACTTYSIGFRAPAHLELAQAFLDHLRDHVDLDGRYADPGLGLAREPARIPAAMQRHASAQLARVRWDHADVARFLGMLLSEPKPSVYFDPPRPALALRAFTAAIGKVGVRLDRRTQWLYDGGAMYVNGEARPWPRGGAAMLKTLADVRSLTAAQARRLPAGVGTLLHADYRHGYLHPG